MGKPRTRAVWGGASPERPCGGRGEARSGASPIGGSGGAPEAPNARSASGGPGGRDRGRRRRGVGRGLSGFRAALPLGAWVRRDAAEPGRAQAGRLGGAVYGEAPDSGVWGGASPERPRGGEARSGRARSGAPGERPKRRTPGAQAEGRGVGTGGDGGGGSGGGFRAFARPCPVGAWVRRDAAEPGRALAGRLGGAVYGEAPDSGCVAGDIAKAPSLGRVGRGGGRPRQEGRADRG